MPARGSGCGRIFQERASGKSIKNRPEMEKAISALGTGDVGRVGSLYRSMIDGVAIIGRINARGALVKVLDKPHLHLITPLGRGGVCVSEHVPAPGGFSPPALGPPPAGDVARLARIRKG